MFFSSLFCSHADRRASTEVTQVRRFALLAAWLLLLPACSDDKEKQATDAGEEPAARPASCEPVGKSVACTGRAGCAGSQVCEESGRYGPCDCGDGVDPLGGGGTTGGGGDAGTMSVMCGAACTADTDCGGGKCIMERRGSRMVEGLGTQESVRFPGGMCSQAPLVPVSSSGGCNPVAPIGQQGCGSCGVCDLVVFSNAIASVCRERCMPSATDNGCSRDEYTCDFYAQACVEGECTNDDDCRVYAEDDDDDGLADSLVYDKASSARCNMQTRRCQVTGKAGAQAGDPCVRNDDCEADGRCLTESGGGYDPPYVGGYCVKDGCDVEGLGCAGQGVCGEPRVWFDDEFLGTVCARSCEVGKETAAEQLGTAGHGAGCRAGYMCIAKSVRGDAKGTCAPGNYNAVTTNNFGALCEENSECYSPFGHGRCVNMGNDRANVSFCTLFDCGTPGIPSDVCGAGNVCATIDGLASCLRSCTNASQCAAGLACTTVGQNMRACIFGCESDAECRADERCSTRTGECLKAVVRDN